MINLDDRRNKLERVERESLLVIVGETGAGKSALALDLAQKLNGEIICADALTVRRKLNIATAKPTAAERAKVPHHMLDVAGACQDYTAAVFKRQAENIISDIKRRGGLPIIVGGSGLYVDALLYDYGFLPPGDRQARGQLNSLGLSGLRHLVKARGLDDSLIDHQNKRRLIRLLETGGARPAKRPLRGDAIVIGIRLSPARLKARLARRVDSMLAAGLEQEVRQLAAAHGWQCEGLKAIGYREWQSYLTGQGSLEDVSQRILLNSLKLARKQRTWFGRNPDIKWFNGPAPAYRYLMSIMQGDK